MYTYIYICIHLCSYIILYCNIIACIFQIYPHIKNKTYLYLYHSMYIYIYLYLYLYIYIKKKGIYIYIKEKNNILSPGPSRHSRASGP